MRVLFSIANFDLVTNYLSAYAQQLIDFAIGQGHKVKILYNDDLQSPARLPQFETELASKPDLLIGMAHGGSNRFTGQDLETLLQKNVNDDALSDVKTYLYACLTAQELGPSAIDKTCPLFVGYTSDWAFIYNPEFEARPLEDPWAQPFFDCGLATGYAILQDKSPKDIYELTLARYDYWYDYWLKQNHPIADDIMTWLNWDKNAFNVLTPEGIYHKAQAEMDDLLKLAIPTTIAGALYFFSKHQ